MLDGDNLIEKIKVKLKNMLSQFQEQRLLASKTNQTLNWSTKQMLIIN